MKRIKTYLKLIRKPYLIFDNHRYKEFDFSVVISKRADIYGKEKISLEKGVFIDDYTLLSADGKGIKIGKNSRVYRGSCICSRGGEIIIGKNCTIRQFCYFGGEGGILIKDCVRIAPGVKIYSYDHKYNRKDIPIYLQGLSLKKVVINDDVWIGSNSVILKGVTIGKGAVIGAGSIVTKDIPEYTVYAGVPAKFIKKR